MAGQEENNINPNPEAYLAQAFRDLANGERTASALENYLNDLEQKIESLLEDVDMGETETGNKGGGGPAEENKDGSKTEKPTESKQQPESNGSEPSSSANNSSQP